MCHTTYSPQPGTEPEPSAVKVRNPNHQTTRKFPWFSIEGCCLVRNLTWHNQWPRKINTPLLKFQILSVWSNQFSSDQSLSHVRLFATPWIVARQASLSISNSRSLLKLMSIESVMPSSHLILCRPLLLLPPIPPSIRAFPMSQLFAWGGHNNVQNYWLKKVLKHKPLLSKKKKKQKP